MRYIGPDIPTLSDAAFLHFRVKNTVGDLILAEGFPPDFTPAGLARQIRAAVRLAAPSVDRGVRR